MGVEGEERDPSLSFEAREMAEIYGVGGARGSPHVADPGDALEGVSPRLKQARVRKKRLKSDA